MHPVVQSQQAAIAAICQRMGVRRLEVFGSAARATDFDPVRSDVDFLVEFNTDPDRRVLQSFFALQEALSQALERRVDLTTAKAIENPYVRATIERDRELVFGS